MEEILELLLSGLLQLLGEILLQAAFEIVAELFGHVLKEPLRRPEPLHPGMAMLGLAIYGAIAGGLSLLLFPRHFIHSTLLRAVGLFIIPLISGFLMGTIGAWRRKNEQETIRLETFFYGAFFAFAMALVRLNWAQ